MHVHGISFKQPEFNPYNFQSHLKSLYWYYNLLRYLAQNLLPCVGDDCIKKKEENRDEAWTLVQRCEYKAASLYWSQSLSVFVNFINVQFKAWLMCSSKPVTRRTANPMLDTRSFKDITKIVLVIYLPEIPFTNSLP